MTPEQRLAVYDYVVEEAKSSNKPKNVTLEDLMFDFEKKNEQGILYRNLYILICVVYLCLHLVHVDKQNISPQNPH